MHAHYGQQTTRTYEICKTRVSRNAQIRTSLAVHLSVSAIATRSIRQIALIVFSRDHAERHRMRIIDGRHGEIYSLNASRRNAARGREFVPRARIPRTAPGRISLSAHFLGGRCLILNFAESITRIPRSSWTTDGRARWSPSTISHPRRTHERNVRARPCRRSKANCVTEIQPFS